MATPGIWCWNGGFYLRSSFGLERNGRPRRWGRIVQQAYDSDPAMRVAVLVIETLLHKHSAGETAYGHRAGDNRPWM